MDRQVLVIRDFAAVFLFRSVSPTSEPNYVQNIERQPCDHCQSPRKRALASTSVTKNGNFVHGHVLTLIRPAEPPDSYECTRSRRAHRNARST